MRVSPAVGAEAGLGTEARPGAGVPARAWAGAGASARARSLLRAVALVAPALLLAVTTAVQAQTPPPRDPPPTPVAQLPDAKIALVVASGSVRDAGINQAVHAGVRTGAAAIGAADPEVLTPRTREDAAARLASLADLGATAVVVVGDLGPETTQVALGYPRVRFIGVGQVPPCLTLEGLIDTLGGCAGDPAALVPNYTILAYREDQAGYLAGIVAASASASGRVGVIGAMPGCEGCVRYMQGFELGARSIKPDITVDWGFAADSDEGVAFEDPYVGRVYAGAFIDVHQPDVVLAAAGRTGEGIFDAACEAGILAVGVDVDMAQAYPKARACLLTSATKGLARSVSESIIGVAAGTLRGGTDTWDAARDGVGYAPFYDLVALLPPDIGTRLDRAYGAMARGTLETCPASCGTVR